MKIDGLRVTSVYFANLAFILQIDSIAEGFRPIIVKECVGDRIPGAVAWNLFDMDAKFGDVETLDTCIEYLMTVDNK